MFVLNCAENLSKAQRMNEPERATLIVSLSKPMPHVWPTMQSYHTSMCMFIFVESFEFEVAFYLKVIIKPNHNKLGFTKINLRFCKYYYFFK